MAFVAIGLFASSVTSNQIVSFVLALALTFWCYFGFDLLSSLFDGNAALWLQSLGMQDHFRSLGRGLIDSRDVVYFLSVTAFFILLTVLSLERRKW